MKLTAAPAAELDQLFSGTRYTEYNLALHSHLPETGNIAGAPTSETVDAVAVPPPALDVQPLSQTEGASPLKAMHDLSNSLDHTQTATGGLIGHGH
jgi:hypothetical protein